MVAKPASTDRLIQNKTSLKLSYSGGKSIATPGEPLRLQGDTLLNKIIEFLPVNNFCILTDPPSDLTACQIRQI